MQSTLFTVPERVLSREADNAIIAKAKTKKKSPSSVKGGGGIISRIPLIVANVEENLGHFKDKYKIIDQEEQLHDFITECIGNSYISIDTETDGLDPMVNKLAGVCVNTYGQSASYIPVNHINYITNALLPNQLPIDFVASEFNRLMDKKPDIDMFNSTFDIRVMRHNGVPNIYCTWDSYLGARILNENEPVNRLKPLHQKYVLDGKEDAFTFEELFQGIPFTMIPIKTGYLYAAHDAEITTEYCDYQRQYLRADHEREDMRNLYWVFKNIEMPCTSVVADLEDTGIELDMEYNEKLKVKYHALLDEKNKAFIESYKPYQDKIDVFNSDKLENPINIASPTQLGILLYDILGCDLYYDKKEKKYKKSTSEDALKQMSNPIAKAILDYREFATIVSTFIDKLPECVNPNDGRIHCNFNQYGADTGRFSSKNPNMQNIPSHNKDIRKMFKATDGYVIMSADYSQQEIKGMAQMCGDEGMIEAFRQGKDFYAEIASVAFGYPYEDCLEFYLDENGKKTDKTNKEGKERRAQAKSILLGINYGRGAQSIAEQLGCEKEDAERIKEDVFKGFPAIAEFERQSYEMVEELGYITTLWGRKRRLPSMMLPDYEFVYKNASANDDPLDFGDDDYVLEVPDAVQDYYYNKLVKCKWYKERMRLFEQADQEGIRIIDHTKDKDYTKVVNARIQGTAADMTKLAMIALSKDERLKELGFRMLIPIHDEILAECPRENMKECVERFAKIMSEAPGEKFVVPISCDVECSDRWYGEVIEV